jgi:hypothetical protein
VDVGIREPEPIPAPAVPPTPMPFTTAIVMYAVPLLLILWLAFVTIRGCANTDRINQHERRLDAISGP